MKHYANFLRQWANDPLQVAAVAPSGASLATLMTEGVNAGPVLELGPGTGVFTQAMIDRGVAEDQLALVELNEDFANDLTKRFPKAQVHRMSAADTTDKVFFEGGVSTVISGLGLLAMPDDVVEAILRGVFHHLKPGGKFVQFTYGFYCPVPDHIMQRLGITSQRYRGTLRNLPPASVYHMTRIGEEQA